MRMKLIHHASDFGIIFRVHFQQQVMWEHNISPLYIPEMIWKMFAIFIGIWTFKQYEEKVLKHTILWKIVLKQ